jgi:hypothetical protein
MASCSIYPSRSNPTDFAIIGPMRFIFALLLVLTIPFNAAYALGTGLCDALEGKVTHAEHLGHHTHVHDHEHETTPNNDLPQPGVDHHHAHAHTVLSWASSSPETLVFQSTDKSTSPRLVTSFTSALLPGIERPPKLFPIA